MGIKMKQFVCIGTLAATLVLGACSKRPETSTVSPPVAPPQPATPLVTPKPPPPPPHDAQPSAAQAPSQGAPVQSVEELSRSTELADLSKALNIYYAQKKRFPASVNELASITPNGIPKLPPGYRYVIDTQNRMVLIAK